MAQSEYLVSFGWMDGWMYCAVSACRCVMFPLLLELCLDRVAVVRWKCMCVDCVCLCKMPHMAFEQQFVCQLLYRSLVKRVWFCVCVWGVHCRSAESWHSCLTVAILFLHTIYSFTPWVSSSHHFPLLLFFHNLIISSHSIWQILWVCLCFGVLPLVNTAHVYSTRWFFLFSVQRTLSVLAGSGDYYASVCVCV